MISQFPWVKSLACFSWIFCWVFLMAEITISANCIFIWKFNLGNPLPSFLKCLAEFFLQLWLRSSFSCKMLTKAHSSLPESASHSSEGSFHGPLHNMAAYFFKDSLWAHWIESGPPRVISLWMNSEPIIRDLSYICKILSPVPFNVN